MSETKQSPNGNLRDLVLAWRESDQRALTLIAEANKTTMTALDKKVEGIGKLVYIGLGLVLGLNALITWVVIALAGKVH